MEADKNHPGVSGRVFKEKAYINDDKYEEQKEFIEDAGKDVKGFNIKGNPGDLYGRSDLSDQEKNEPGETRQHIVIEALKQSPEVDISSVDVEVNEGTVTLSGIVDSIAEERALDRLVRNVPGVSQVVMNLQTKEGHSL